MWIYLSVCCPWGPSSFYLWTAVLTASFFRVVLQVRRLSEGLNSFKTMALKFFEGADYFKRVLRSKVQISVRCCPMKDQHSYPNSGSSNRQSHLRFEKKP